MEAVESSDSTRISELGEELESLLRIEEAHSAPPEPPRPRIFVSYSREDKGAVAKLYKRLSSAGFRPWMDTEDLLAGENWRTSIAKAIRSSDFVLTCLSSKSVSSEGVTREETEFALNVWREKFEAAIYLIPVRLEACDPPKSLRIFHWVDLFEPDGWELLVRSIREGMGRRAADHKAVFENAETTPLSVPGLIQVRRFIEEGGRVADYQKGMQFYGRGFFTQAKVHFDALGEYQNSGEMSQLSRAWIEVIESAQARNWPEAKRLLEALTLREKGPRARSWIRWCLWARKVVPVLEAMAAGPYVCEAGIAWEGKESPYKILANGASSRRAPCRSLERPGFQCRARRAECSQVERAAWDGLRIVENRLAIDFALYTVRDAARARALAERVCSIEEGKDPGMTTQEVVTELQEDSGVFLVLLQNYDQAIKTFLAEACAHSGDAITLHHLGLAAAAQIHWLESNAGDYQDLAAAWQWLIIGWAAVFADDRFWHRWWAGRRSCYNAPVNSEQIQNVRLRLQRFWFDQIKSATDIWPGIDTVFQAEFNAARSVQAGKGIPIGEGIEGGAVVGMMGARSLGLLDALARWTASFAPNEVLESGWQQRVCGYFSELAEACALFDEGRYGSAIATLESPHCDVLKQGDKRCRVQVSKDHPTTAAADCPCFTDANPAFSKLDWEPICW